MLYKNATFLNLVDPISHDLLMSLARDLQCPKKVNPSLSSIDILQHSTDAESPDGVACAGWCSAILQNQPVYAPGVVAYRLLCIFL